MKILLVAPQPFYVERGTPIAVRLLVQTLCDLGHEVDLLVYHEGRDIQVKGLTVIRARRPPGITSVPIGISVKKLVCDVFLVWRMIGLLRRKRYDVVHAVEEAIFAGAFLRPFLHRYRLVYDMDSSMADQVVEKWTALKPVLPAMEIFERAAVKHSDAVLAVCEDLAVKVRRWAPAEKVVVLPDVPMGDVPVRDASTLSRRQLELDRSELLHEVVGSQGVLALYVGNLEYYQGIDLLLESLALVPRELGVHTVLIGGSEAHVQRYRQRAAQLGIDDRVHLLGPRPLARLGIYLAQADILLSPRTLGQNTPMKIYSYMQAGRAILATAIRSHTQALDADCAELAAAEPHAFAAGFTNLARDPARRERLGHAAHAKAEREYSLPVYVEKLRGVYARLESGL